MEYAFAEEVMSEIPIQIVVALHMKYSQMTLVNVALDS